MVQLSDTRQPSHGHFRLLRQTLWRRFSHDLRKRKQWDDQLVWLRMRYADAGRATKALQLLSQPAHCGRIVVYFVPDKNSGQTLSKLFVGVAMANKQRLLQLGTDYDLRLETANIRLPPPQPMQLVSALPWGRSFVAHLSLGRAFVNVEPPEKGLYFPVASAATPRGSWCLPPSPPAGITAVPNWDRYSPSHELLAANARHVAQLDSGCGSLQDAQSEGLSQSGQGGRQQSGPPRWPLGWSKQGQALHCAGRINLYGQRDAVASWLVKQISQALTDDPKHLIVLDAIGDVVPKLKRKRAVTRLLGKQLTYLDIDGASLTTGCNPLAALPEETDAALVQRWHNWFAAMQVTPDSLALLPAAHQAGVTDLPALQQWLTQRERQGNLATVAALRVAFNRLTSERTLCDWLAWPTNPFAQLPTGILLVSCRLKKGTEAATWGRIQLMNMFFLAAQACPAARLVLHGLPWEQFLQPSPKQPLLISNGPPLADATVVLASCLPASRQHIQHRFLAPDIQLIENFGLLSVEESIVVHGATACWAGWKKS